ncbi:23S rRNA (adenine(2503)-C(2))-methyltransferase RlmN [Soehngenia longivitae]|uniref:Probable dual-specificity RNA methyltransferase RlmN n=1 Tax=Soehngenia longivitae TaxID=2562294 RepID=A0A4Z0D565_9FIRM|nr:23S rRNA (adenine(2503)-C(2))-methyltransferase RlmN [Soehngenia longivitae]TFZ39573.1 23S rRNA (adenine(2503)-C(2))-methyltransferase RlmN [Soehngenia longivitae]
MKKELNGISYNDLEKEIISLGIEKYRTKQIFDFVHNKKIDNFNEITNIPKKLREVLDENYILNKIKIYDVFKSGEDDTIKFLFLLNDGNIIESVIMKYKYGYSQCISTQVGCKMGCEFCASTKEGFIRNLTAAEILDQVYCAEDYIDIKVKNIVLMGSGEPLDNYSNVLDFIKLISDKNGHNTSLRHITLSTCGVADKIIELANENLPITLSLSLHSPFDDRRQLIMPIAKKYKIKNIMEAVRYYYKKTNRRITFEYTLIDGFNNRLEDANELKSLIKDLDVHINLITLNPIKEFNYGNNANPEIEKFYNILIKKGLKVTIRREMGSDISASCGQLKRSVITRKEE